MKMFADLDSWRGVRPGMAADAVTATLRARDPTIEVRATGSDLSLTGDGWRASVSLDVQDCIYGDIRVRYEPALGIGGAREVLARRLAEYGPPRAVRLVPRGIVQVEWAGREMDASVGLQSDSAGTFTVVEAYGPAATRGGAVLDGTAARDVIARARATLGGKLRADCDAIATAFAIVDELDVHAPLIDAWNSIAALRDELELEVAHPDAALDTMFVIVDGEHGGSGDVLHAELSEWQYTRDWSIRQLAARADLRDLMHDPAERVPPLPDERVIVIEGRHAAAVAPRIAGARPDGTIVRVLASAAPLPVGELDEQVFDVPSEDAGSLKWHVTRAGLFPIRIAHRPTGLAVYVNCASSLDEARGWARRVLAARVAASS